MSQHRIKVRMLATKPGSEDGNHVKTFYENEEYMVGHDLAEVFISQKWASEVVEHPVAPPAAVVPPAPPAPPAPAVPPAPEQKPVEPKKKNG